MTRPLAREIMASLDQSAFSHRDSPDVQELKGVFREFEAGSAIESVGLNPDLDGRKLWQRVEKRNRSTAEFLRRIGLPA